MKKVARPHVVLASRLFSPEVSAAAFRLRSLSLALSSTADVEVVTSIPPAHAPQTPDPSAISISRARVLRDPGGNVRGYIQYMSFDVPLFFRLLRRRFDLAIAESPPTTGMVVAAVCALKRRPFVYYAADVWTDGVISMGAPKPVVAVMRWLERSVLRRAARILSVSDEVTQRLELLDAASDRISTIGNGIDTEVFRPDVDGASTEDYFVYTGTLSEWQRPERFVEALALIADDEPTVGIRFYGQGALLERTKQLAEELVPGRIVFGGVVSPAESARWIRGAVGALVSIVPGIGYDFARPTKTYAAAACGTPVLFAGASTGGALVRENRLGLGVDFTATAIADAMRELLDQRRSGLTEQLRMTRGRWAADNVSLVAAGERAADATLNVLQETMSAPSRLEK
ncbi:glycosyltransferase involved in cell wall biosynthesis [Microbacterium sp. W4I4]|uniref:glycosyltransferase n=1 Tax=Microbacterium sp. W4I4 TaxID=3042295 RepID=UPI002783CFC9|nr:glycosyltransferase [Microbacterium sp. W4I4]MDQ0613321.1 glycosyltransferase involved in cell wall biosynthesis [Microbacterium sp. W4I4]